MSKKEKFIQGMYIFAGYVNTVLTIFFCFLGIGYMTELNLSFTKKEYITIISVWLAVAIVIGSFFMLFFDLYKKIDDFGKNSILLILSCLLCLNIILSDYKESIIEICIFVVMNSFVRKLIEFAVNKGKYDPACIGYKDVLIKREEVNVLPMYSKEVWKNFISHIDECSEEKKKIMAREIETFADRIYTLDEENLKLLSVVEDKRSYVEQVEIYYDKKNQRLVKYYRYDYENYESKKGLEKLLLWLNKKRKGSTNISDK